MCCEWRSNLWMMVELVVVGLVLWAVFAVLISILSFYQAPKGVDFNNLYTGYIGYINSDADEYKPYDAEHSYSTDLEMIKAKLKSNPAVETVGTGTNLLPYNYSYHGNNLRAKIDTAMQSYMGNIRKMDEDAIRAIRLTGINGETTDDLAELIRRGDVIISQKEVYWGQVCEPERWRGVDAWYSYDSTQVVHVGAVINPIRRMDFERCSGVIIMPPENMVWGIVIRVKDGQEARFLETLTGDDLEYGNVYVSDLRSLDSIRSEAHRDIYVVIRNVGVCALFVMISVFLGFLGTFWFRTQQRVPELALRKVNGATNADIFRRLISEGLLLLVIPAVIIIAVNTWGAHYLLESDLGGDISGFGIDASILWIAAAASIVVMAVMIVAGIAVPARKAMKIEPAAALSEQ